MPKFLDAPSWYDKNGDQRTIVTTMRIGMSNTGRGGYCNVPVISEGSASLDDIPEQPLYTLPFVSGTQSVGVIPYWSGTRNGYLVTLKGTSGQVLTWSGGRPSWRTLSLYLHRIYITGGTTGKFTINVYSMSSTTVSNNNVSGLVSFLRSANCTSIDTFFVANGVSFHTNTDARTVVGVYASSSNEYFYPVITQKDGSYDEGLETGKILSSSSGTIITEYVIEI